MDGKEYRAKQGVRFDVLDHRTTFDATSRSWRRQESR